jgi:outer membrane protein, heavy metal efflux system
MPPPGTTLSVWSFSEIIMFVKRAWPHRAVLCSAVVALVGAGASAQAQPAAPTATASIAQLLEAAWQRHPAAAGQGARRAAAQAQREAAGRLTPEPAALSLAHRTDQLTRNQGQREYEAELSAPLWLPGQRAATRALGEADVQGTELHLQIEKLKLAQDIRQRWWALVQAANLLRLERSRVADAQQLAADLQQRLKAGEVARTDANQAQGLVQGAVAAQLEAEQSLEAQLADLHSLTGVPAETLLQGAERSPVFEAIEPANATAAHPELSALRLAQRAAQARLQLVAHSTRANPSVSLGVIRERDAFGEPAKNTLRVSVSLPFSSAPASTAQTEGARADALEADAVALRAEERLRAQQRAARSAVERARKTLAAAERRALLSADTRTLLERAHRLGEVDLATRLRAQADHVEAQRAMVQAQAHLGRTLSELKHSLGLLP